MTSFWYFIAQNRPGKNYVQDIEVHISYFHSIKTFTCHKNLFLDTVIIFAWFVNGTAHIRFDCKSVLRRIGNMSAI